MQLPIYQVDAFTDKLFGGNPAAVVPLNEWLPEELMQNIALENNLSETAFFVPTDNGYHIRWFTPVAEVALCGHATLATACVLFKRLNYSANVILFESKSGVLKVTNTGDLLELDFPVQPIAPASAPDLLVDGIGPIPMEIYRAADDYVLVYAAQNDIENLQPDFGILKNVKARGIIVTAPAASEELDFVCRFFGPAVGVNEDPVTGSAFTKLVPYWAKRTGKLAFKAEQVSARRGKVLCKIHENRVLIAGSARIYLEGTITV